MNPTYPWREAPEAEYAVIGDPVAHSRSPKMHMAAYKELGLPYRYVAIQVPPGEVGAALEHMREKGYRGTNVTLPHKEEAMHWCLHVDGFCERVGAVNTISLERRAGINTDANGFLATLEGVSNREALMLGAGGSARAIAYALERDGWTVRIHNRTPEKAVALAELTGATAVTEPDPTGAGLILNTTSASLTGEEPPVLWERAAPDALAYDLAYGDSPFLESAKGRGLRTIDGLPMLVEQGALSIEWWTGAYPSRETMREAIR